MIKLIIFDYDGVIVDSFICMYNVYKIICEKLGKEFPDTFEKFKVAYGYSSRELAKNLGFSDEELIESDKIFGEETLKQTPEIFNGITEAIKGLSENYLMVVVSSARALEVNQKLDRFNLRDYFDEVFGSDSGAPMKKRPVLKEIFKKYNVEPSEVLMIADRDIDFDAGTDVGFPSENLILVEYGWGYDHEKIPKMKVIVDKPEDLIKAVDAVTS